MCLHAWCSDSLESVRKVWLRTSGNDLGFGCFVFLPLFAVVIVLFPLLAGWGRTIGVIMVKTILQASAMSEFGQVFVTGSGCLTHKYRNHCHANTKDCVTFPFMITPDTTHWSKVWQHCKSTEDGAYNWFITLTSAGWKTTLILLKEHFQTNCLTYIVILSPYITCIVYRKDVLQISNCDSIALT